MWTHLAVWSPRKLFNFPRLCSLICSELELVRCTMKLVLMTEQGVTGALLCISALPGEFSRLCSEYSGSQSLLPPPPRKYGAGSRFTTWGCKLCPGGPFTEFLVMIQHLCSFRGALESRNCSRQNLPPSQLSLSVFPHILAKATCTSFQTSPRLICDPATSSSTANSVCRAGGRSAPWTRASSPPGKSRGLPIG